MPTKSEEMNRRQELGWEQGWNEAIEAAANLFSPNDWEGWIPGASDEIAERAVAAIRKLKKP